MHGGIGNFAYICTCIHNGLGNGLNTLMLVENDCSTCISMTMCSLFAKMASHKPQRTKRTSRRQQGLEPLVEKTQGVVGSAETGSPSGKLLLLFPRGVYMYIHRLFQNYRVSKVYCYCTGFTV